MNYPEILSLVGGTAAILIGVFLQNSSFAERIIRFRNSIQGTKTQITKASLLANKINGTIFIVIGLGAVLFGFGFF